MGKDEDSVQFLQRKLEALALEVTAFQPTIAKLSNTSNSLVERGHFDATNVAAKQVKYT